MKVELDAGEAVVGWIECTGPGRVNVVGWIWGGIAQVRLGDRAKRGARSRCAHSRAGRDMKSAGGTQTSTGRGESWMGTGGGLDVELAGCPAALAVRARVRLLTHNHERADWPHSHHRRVRIQVVYIIVLVLALLSRYKVGIERA